MNRRLVSQCAFDTGRELVGDRTRVRTTTDPLFSPPGASAFAIVRVPFAPALRGAGTIPSRQLIVTSRDPEEMSPVSPLVPVPPRVR